MSRLVVIQYLEDIIIADQRKSFLETCFESRKSELEIINPKPKKSKMVEIKIPAVVVLQKMIVVLIQEFLICLALIGFYSFFERKFTILQNSNVVIGMVIVVVCGTVSICVYRVISACKKWKFDQIKLWKSLDAAPKTRVHSRQVFQKESEMLFFEKHYFQSRECLQNLYDLPVLKQNYRNSIAVSELLMFFLSDRCSSLEEAYILYEAEESTQNTIRAGWSMDDLLFYIDKPTRILSDIEKQMLEQNQVLIDVKSGKRKLEDLLILFEEIGERQMYSLRTYKAELTTE